MVWCRVCKANAMETSIADHQAIRKIEDEQVREGARYGTMILSAGGREAVAGGRDYKDTKGQSIHFDPPREPLSTIRTARPNIQFSTRWHRSFGSTLGYLLVLVAGLWIVPAAAVQLDFDNCLSESAKHNEPLQLQFVPLYVNAVFNAKDSNHSLNVTVWGNVTGSTAGNAARLILPSANSTYWSSNDTDLGGKIADSPYPDETSPKLTTLSNKVDVLTYQPWSKDVDFCQQLVNGTCALGPVFTANASMYELPSFGFQNNFYSTYAFTSFAATLLVKYGDQAATPISCTSVIITPDIGTTLSSVVRYIPAAILMMVAIATAFAAIYSPWGTTDTFRWTTNYGRDDDLLRLVTPGFGDCLQYIQFVALTGGLTLNYPGFYQPIVSKVAWSTLLFNESFVSSSNGTDSLVDGIYVTHGTYGLDKLRQLVGISEIKDVWAGMAVWLLIILAVALALIQLGFFIRWVYRLINHTHEEDLRAKNMPFSVGNVIRIVFNYFLLPIVALSMFQLIEAGKGPAYTVALAVVMLALVIGFAVWLLYIIGSTKPKSVLFDDLPTLLTYGSLYNTYSDHAAPFALVPILLTFVRGIAIGAVQPSGIAQLVLLAICEVITVLTLHAFRPFHSPTSMNAWHTIFSVIRFSTILLMISFAPSLGVTEGPKGWIGYAILLMHAIVLFLGFLLNSLQTIVEVAARLAGAGGEEGGATRGGLVRVFGMRQLSRRMPRRDQAASRASQLSSAAMLSGKERESYMMENGRLRAQSVGSANVLINRQSTGHLVDGIEPFGAIGPQSGYSSYTPTTPGEASSFSFLPATAAPSGLGRNRGPIIGLSTTDTSDPYYRPPRLRRPTLEAYSPGAQSRGSWASGDWAKRRVSNGDTGSPEPAEEGPPVSRRGTPTSGDMPPPVDGSPNDPRRSQADYTTREVDFYYGVRGPALNANVPNRRNRTGPADPTGIPASAAGWFKSLFGGKTKEKGKGFEVVRSSRMPPNMARNAPGQETPPEGIPVTRGGVRHGPIDSDDDEPSHPGPSRSGLPVAGASTVDPSTAEASVAATPAQQPKDELISPLSSDNEDDDDRSVSSADFEITRISDIPPTLAGLEIPGGGIELPSRFPSKATSRASSRRVKRAQVDNVPAMPPARQRSDKPHVPRKSSRRKSQNVDIAQHGENIIREQRPQSSLDPGRQPFDRSNSSKRHSDMSTRSGVTDPDLGHSRNQSALGNKAADVSNDRPTGVGFVHQHHIRTHTPDNNHDFLGSSAEVIDGQHSGTSSMENQQSPRL